MKKILVVGGGWAGLSAALHLSQNPNNQVTVFEAAPQVGGRARGVRFSDQDWVDNGQHLLLSAYTEVKTLLRLINSPPSHYDEQDFKLTFFKPKGKMSLTFPKNPSVVAGLKSLIMAQGLSFKERLQLAKFMRQLNQETSVPGLSAEAYLQRDLSQNLIKALWEPLCLAALSTPLHKASAQVFVNVLQACFNQARAAQILWPHQDVGQFLPKPVVDYLRACNHKVLLHSRASELIIRGDQCLGVIVNKIPYLADAVVLAMPPKTAAQLLPVHPLLQGSKANLNQFEYEPITTLYVKYEQMVNFPQDLFGLANSPFHWIFNRQTSGQGHFLAAVITGPSHMDDLSATAMADLLEQELQALGINLPQRVSSKVIREKQAAFSCTVAAQALRPSNNSPLNNLWLAGDYTQTPYPATLEGAVLSGRLCAMGIDATC